MQNRNYDLSDLAPKISNSSKSNYDLSDLALKQNNAAIPSLKNNVINDFLKSMAIPKNSSFAQQTGLNTASGFKSALGEALPFAAGLIPGVGLGELALGAGAKEGLPALGRYALNKLGNLGVGTAITTTSSELNPQNKNSLNRNLQQNLGENALLEGIGPVLKVGSKILDYAKPQKYAEEIINKLSGLNIGENGRIFANKIKDAYNKVKRGVQNDYNSIFNRSDVVRGSGIGSEISQSGGYLDIDKKVIDAFTPKIDQAHYKFISNPSLYNAHLLRHELGDSIRELESTKKKSGLSNEDEIVKQNREKAFNTLNENMNEGFDKIDQSLRDNYSDANQKYIENVVPYLENDKIRKIVTTEPNRLKASDVKNISNEFENPSENIQKIVNDIGPSAKHHIMAEKFGQLQGKVTPEKLQLLYNDLKNKGYSQYITPEIENMFNKLSFRQKAKLGLQGAPGAISALALSSHLPLIAQVAEAPAMIGASIYGSKGISKILPKVNPLSSPELKKVTRITGRSGINYINNS